MRETHAQDLLGKVSTDMPYLSNLIAKGTEDDDTREYLETNIARLTSILRAVEDGFDYD